MSEVKIPWCARCGHPVAEILRYYDSRTMEAVFTVRCHGESQTVRLDRDTLYNASIEMAAAFGELSLEGPVPFR